MEIILSKQCESLTGTLDVGFGYYIRSTKTGRFFSQRSRHSVPRDGHWRFIVACAELAQNRLHIADIEVSGYELKVALSEARLFASSLRVDLDHLYNAKDVLQFKTERGL